MYYYSNLFWHVSLQRMHAICHTTEIIMTETECTISLHISLSNKPLL